MIEQLLVKDYVLFDHEQIDFSEQMTAITGETGAGKSLLIDAIGYLCGNRLNGNVVRPGASKAVLQMILSDPSKQALDLLEEGGFDQEDEILITRTIFPNGKSRIQVNGQNATNGFVKKLTAAFIDVHSQMDTIKLIDPAVQLGLLDQYAQSGPLLEQVEQAYKDYSAARRKLVRLQNETFSNAELERLTGILNEIEQAKLQPGELEELEEQIKEASLGARELEDYDQILYQLKKEDGLLDQINTITKVLKKNPSMHLLYDQFLNIEGLFESFKQEIEEKKESLQELGESLDEMMSRQFEIRRLFRQYGPDYESVMKTKASVEEKISLILNRQEVFEKLDREVKSRRRSYARLALELSKKRKASFKELEKQIVTHARDLMLEHIQFEIRQKDKAISPNGIDEIEFYASMNPGQPLTSLKQAGSGGELSRLMLALKTVFQAENGITTLIFDEIDTGVSGKVALSMGGKMNTLSRNYQVLCITHLPSVAVWADDHLRVIKAVEDERTRTSVEHLDQTTRFEELALMSSGSITPESVESMRNLHEKIHHG